MTELLSQPGVIAAIVLWALGTVLAYSLCIIMALKKQTHILATPIGHIAIILTSLIWPVMSLCILVSKPSREKE